VFVHRSACHMCWYSVVLVLVQHMRWCTVCASACVSMFVCIHTHTDIVRTYDNSGMCMCACVHV